MKKIFIILIMSLLVTNVYAVMIGDFPGIEKLADKSDAIVILRIDANIDPQSSQTLYTTHSCYIYQTLKGNIETGKTINLQLMNTRTSWVTPFAINSTHLMFLTKKRTENEPTDYRTIEINGANIKLSPFGHEKSPEGKTLVEKIKFLIKQSMEYWNKENKKEEEFLKSFIKN